MRVRKFFTVGILVVFSVIVISASAYAVDEQKPMIDVVAEKGVLRLGWAIWYPLAYVDPTAGKPAGMSIDLARDLADKLGVTLELVEGSFGTIAAGLKGNKYDMWMNLSVSLPRAFEITFTKPVMATPLAHITTVQWWKEHSHEISHPLDLDNPKYTVGVVSGADTDLQVTEIFKKAKIVRFGTDAEALMALRSGRSSTFVGNMTAIAVLAKQEGLVPIPGTFGRKRPVCFGIKRGDFVSWLWLNHWIDDAKERGIIRKLAIKHDLSEEVLTE